MDSELVTTLALAFDSRLFSSGCFLASSVMGIVQNFDRRSLVFFTVSNLELRGERIRSQTNSQ
jgi:hypothetical protein